MTFNPDADVSRNRARRPGRTAAIAGGGAAGLLGIAVLVVNLLTGGDFDLSPLLGGGAEQRPSSSESSVIEDCDTGADANESADCRVAASSLALDEFWTERVDGYRPPTLYVPDGPTSTPCGTASNAVGPFYCPADESVYIDPSFFEILQQRFGASGGPLAQLYIVAHEYGHHVQHITGTMDRHPHNGTGPESNGVRTELQADCYAGAWVGAMTEQEDENGVPYLQAPTAQDLRDALDAASAVGDDHIQGQSGQVNPETWTHGSSEQRERWFDRGYRGGIGQCDTFDIDGSEL